MSISAEPRTCSISQMVANVAGSVMYTVVLVFCSCSGVVTQLGDGVTPSWQEVVLVVPPTSAFQGNRRRLRSRQLMLSALSPAFWQSPPGTRKDHQRSWRRTPRKPGRIQPGPNRARLFSFPQSDGTGRRLERSMSRLAHWCTDVLGQRQRHLASWVELPSVIGPGRTRRAGCADRPLAQARASCRGARKVRSGSAGPRRSPPGPSAGAGCAGNLGWSRQRHRPRSWPFGRL